jgi:hypothetical protein
MVDSPAPMLRLGMAAALRYMTLYEFLQIFPEIRIIYLYALDNECTYLGKFMEGGLVCN